MAQHEQQSSAASLSTMLDRQAMAAAQIRINRLEAAAAQLEARAERAEQLAGVKNHALITLDLAGQITSCNIGATSILGYTERELLGCSGSMLFLLEDRERGLFQEEICWAAEEGYAVNERWHLRRDGSRFWASGSMTLLLDLEGQPKGFLNVFRDNTALHMESEHHALRLVEMGHRLKNTLTTVQAIAQQTLRRGGVAQEIQDTFQARLIALARAHDLLIRNHWEGAALLEVVEQVLMPYGDGGRIHLRGLPLWLPATAVEPLALTCHELATNAAKYGALSVTDGSVDLSWHLNVTADGTRLARIVWQERGGPVVTPPAHRGFGSRLLEQGPVQHLNGSLQLAFHPEGLECQICLPLR